MMMLPSGATTGEDVPSSMILPAPRRFWAGSTPGCAPARLPVGRQVGVAAVVEPVAQRRMPPRGEIGIDGDEVGMPVRQVRDAPDVDRAVRPDGRSRVHRRPLD